MKAKTNQNLRYYDVNHYLHISNEIEIGSKEWYEAIYKAGYKYFYRWINSDNEWQYFAKTDATANQGALELYCKEKNYDEKFAKDYYGEKVDVWNIKDYIQEVF